MGRRIPSVLLALATISTSAVRGTDVYVVAGQSNGHRLSTLRPGPLLLPDGRRIFYYGMSCTAEPGTSTPQVLRSLDPGSTGSGLALALLEHSGDDIVLVQYCRCGSALWRRRNGGWFPGTDPARGDVFDGGLFAKFTEYLSFAESSATAELGLAWRVRALFWHQGESDSSGDHYRHYQDTLEKLLWRFRQALGEHTPIVLAEIRELSEGARGINRALRRIASDDPLVALASASDLDFETDLRGQPGLHLSVRGAHRLGRRMAAAYDSLTPR